MRFLNYKAEPAINVKLLGVILFCFFQIIIAQTQKEYPNSQNKQIQEFQLTAQVENGSATIRVGDPVQVVLTIKNNSNEEIFFLESCVSLDYKFLVKDEQGKIVSLTKEGERLTNRNEVNCLYRKSKIKPGKLKQNLINLVNLYDLSAKGKYYLSAIRSVRKDENELIKLESNIIEIIIE